MMGGGFGGLGMLLFWGGIIYLVVWLARGSTNQVSGSNRRSALDILDERYAHNKIGQEEYLEKRRALT